MRGIIIDVSCFDILNCRDLLYLAGEFNVMICLSMSISLGVSRDPSIGRNPDSFNNCRKQEYLGPNPAIN